MTNLEERQSDKYDELVDVIEAAKTDRKIGAASPAVTLLKTPLMIMSWERAFTRHPQRSCIAPGRTCNTTRVRGNVTLSGVRDTVLSYEDRLWAGLHP